LIAVAATGVDNIDLDYCRQHGIAVCNAQHYAGNSLPEHVLMLMLTLRRNLRAYLEDVRAGAWQQANQFCLLDHPIHDLRGTTLGIIGYGFLGKAVGSLVHAVGMKLLIAEREAAVAIRPGRTAFNQVLEASDVITLHCPLTAETRNLIDWPELQMMKRGSVLINTARGGLVNEVAVLRALREGLIAGAAFDVLSEEPPRGGNPLLAEERPNLIVTPHVAWASREAMQTLADQLVASLEAFVRGETAHRVV
jgi:glycerate dehydrogenase